MDIIGAYRAPETMCILLLVKNTYRVGVRKELRNVSSNICIQKKVVEKKTVKEIKQEWYEGRSREK